MNTLTSGQRKLVYGLGIMVLMGCVIWLGQPSDGEPGSGGKVSTLREKYSLGEATLGNVDPASSTMNLVLLGFHAAVGYFFNIGMFPFIMTTSALIFFAPSWPRELAAWLRRRPQPAPAATGAAALPAPRVAPRWLGVLLGVHVVVQLALPLRHHLYPGDVLWNEDGARFAWQVMVREKHGSVTFVAHLADGRRLEVPPRRYLTARQEREMAGQPDLIAQLARRIAADLRADGHAGVEIRVESAVSLDGRDPVALIEPAVDLARVHDLGARWWVTAAPSQPPIHLRARP